MGDYLNKEDLHQVFSEIHKIEDCYQGEAQRSSVLAVRGKIKSDQVQAEIDVAKADAVKMTGTKIIEILYRYWPREKV